MDYKYNFFSSSICKFDLLHDSQYITIYFVMEGTAKMIRNKVDFGYVAGDVFVTTPEMRASHIESMNGHLLCLSINKIHFNQFYLKNVLNEKGISDIQSGIKEAFMQALCCTYHQNLFQADIQVIQLINYVRVYFKSLDNYTFSQSNNCVINQVIEHVNTHFKQTLKLSDLARDYYVNSSFLSRKFKEEMNIKFNEYVKQVKLIHLAEELLLRGNEVELWKEYNFASYRTFLKNFKTQFDMTPTEFIIRYKKYKKTESCISEYVYQVIANYLQSKL